MSQKCSECSAALADGQMCRDYFHQMLFWEDEDPERWKVHHLMVLCYHLQHPSLYSAQGLTAARGLLADFVGRGLSPEEVRRRNREHVASGKREWPITARPGNRGAYKRPIMWTMTAGDVVAGGAERYCENVKAWAASVSKSLEVE